MNDNQNVNNNFQNNNMNQFPNNNGMNQMNNNFQNNNINQFPNNNGMNHMNNNFQSNNMNQFPNNNGMNQMNNNFQNNNMNQFPNNNGMNQMNNNFQNNNMNQFSNNNGMSQPMNKPFNIKIIAIIIGILLIIVIAILLLTKSNDNDNDKNDKNTTNNNTPTNTPISTNNGNNNGKNGTANDLQKNIVINSVKSTRGDEILFIKNNNNTTVSFQCNFDPYDASGNYLYADEYSKSKDLKKSIAITSFSPGEEVIVNPVTRAIPSYDHYKLSNIEVREYGDWLSKNVTKYVEVLSDTINDKGSVEVTLKNNYDKKLNVDIIILYYNDDELLGMEKTMLNIESGQTQEKEMLKITDKNGSVMKFNKHKVIVRSESYY